MKSRVKAWSGGVANTVVRKDSSASRDRWSFSEFLLVFLHPAGAGDALAFVGRHGVSCITIAGVVGCVDSHSDAATSLTRVALSLGAVVETCLRRFFSRALKNFFEGFKLHVLKHLSFTPNYHYDVIIISQT